MQIFPVKHNVLEVTSMATDINNNSSATTYEIQTKKIPKSKLQSNCSLRLEFNFEDENNNHLTSFEMELHPSNFSFDSRKGFSKIINNSIEIPAASFLYFIVKEVRNEMTITSSSSKPPSQVPSQPLQNLDVNSLFYINNNNNNNENANNNSPQSDQQIDQHIGQRTELQSGIDLFNIKREEAEDPTPLKRSKGEDLNPNSFTISSGSGGYPITELVFRLKEHPEFISILEENNTKIDKITFTIKNNEIILQRNGGYFDIFSRTNRTFLCVLEGDHYKSFGSQRVLVDDVLNEWLILNNLEDCVTGDLLTIEIVFSIDYPIQDSTSNANGNGSGDSDRDRDNEFNKFLELIGLPKNDSTNTSTTSNVNISKSEEFGEGEVKEVDEHEEKEEEDKAEEVGEKEEKEEEEDEEENFLEEIKSILDLFSLMNRYRSLFKEQPKTDYYKEGKALYYVYKYKEAIEKLKQAIRLDSSVSKFHYLVGRCYFMRKEYSKALPYFSQAVKLDPNNEENLSSFAMVNYLFGKSNIAVENFEKALTINPNNVFYYFMIADCLFNLNRKEEALKQCDRVIQLHPNEAYLYYNKARYLTLYFGVDEKMDEKISTIDRAISIDVDDPDFYVLKGLLLTYRGEGYRGHRMIEEYFPHSSIKRSSRSYYFLKKFKSDLDYFNSALLCRTFKDKYNANYYFDSAIKLNPNNGIYYKEKGDLLYELENNNDALKMFERAIHFEPNSEKCYKKLGKIAYQLGRYEKAIECYSKALEFDHSNAHYHCNIGNSLYKLRRFHEAIDHYDKALEIDYDDFFLEKKEIATKMANRISRRKSTSDSIATTPSSSSSSSSSSSLSWFSKYFSFWLEEEKVETEIEKRRKFHSSIRNSFNELSDENKDEIFRYFSSFTKMNDKSHFPNQLYNPMRKSITFYYFYHNNNNNNNNNDNNDNSNNNKKNNNLSDNSNNPDNKNDNSENFTFRQCPGLLLPTRFGKPFRISLLCDETNSTLNLQKMDYNYNNYYWGYISWIRLGSVLLEE